MTKRDATVEQKSRPFAAFEWMVASRYMIPSRKQGFTSVISVISFIGVMIGVWALIVVMSVMNGFHSELTSRILGINGDLLLRPGLDSNFDDYETLAARLAAVKGVKLVLPLVEGQGLVQGEFGGGTGALIRGLRMADLEKLQIVSSNIKEGSLHDLVEQEQPARQDTTGPRHPETRAEELAPDTAETAAAPYTAYNIAIGQKMAETLGLSVGNILTVISPEGDQTPMGMMPRMKEYKVAAVFKTGMNDYDAAIIYMPLEEAQLFFNMEGTVPMFEVFTDDPFAVDALKPKLEEAAGRSLFTSDWKERNQNFLGALRMESTVMFFILSLIVLVAALNIISGLIMLVRDKTHDIAVLRTMGAGRGAIMRIFIMAGLAIGISGTFFGVILGVVTSLNVERIHNFIAGVTGRQLFNPDAYYLSQLPSKLDGGQVFMVVVMALVLSFLATLQPALKAARLDPVQALRYE
ncbi:MAG: LolC/E family lipoprotein-releasing system transmembrane protein [Candidatus Tokpelaia hoelldobleri]|uniref:LolC/E family lipoprotein-releasing system transmembrane protein n=1 Tax=Candidatus Tokpelaia hoelldobleri TaxID=1902579 RepID=A0A1U9JV88_9HYPH|nr:MAG: LolC/E family lipoprotein-releasing system transmembrane protein [Candidatus Tokpelaia hoelldoblerii]